MSKNQPKKISKRQALREKRRKKEQQQRLITIGAILLIALVLVVVIAAPSIIEANTPVGEFVSITPHPIPMPDGTAMGDPDAPVLIEIYEDFKCVACKGYSQSIEPLVVNQIVEPGKAYYVFRQYPFLDDRSSLKESDQSAHASMCAAEQNRFWDYKQILYENMENIAGEFNSKRLKAFAQDLGLDTNQFNECYDEKRYQADINEDLASGQQKGEIGTPSVFVNGQDISPGHVPDFSQVNSAVEAALAAGDS